MSGFVDEIIIKTEAGKGGDGAVSFWKERYKPFGGPDGGSGGRGGNVILKVSRSLTSLDKFLPNKIYRAGKGKQGSGRKKSGKKGKK